MHFLLSLSTLEFIFRLFTCGTQVLKKRLRSPRIASSSGPPTPNPQITSGSFFVKLALPRKPPVVIFPIRRMLKILKLKVKTPRGVQVVGVPLRYQP